MLLPSCDHAVSATGEKLYEKDKFRQAVHVETSASVEKHTAAKTLVFRCVVYALISHPEGNMSIAGLKSPGRFGLVSPSVAVTIPLAAYVLGSQGCCYVQV